MAAAAAGTGPFENRGLPIRIGNRVLELDIPVHAAAKRLVLRMPAPAQRIMLTGSARDAVGAVPGDLDHWLTRGVPVGVGAGLGADDAVAERPRRAVAYRADDLIHPPAAGGDEGFLALAEDGRQLAGAISRVLA